MPLNASPSPSGPSLHPGTSEPPPPIHLPRPTAWPAIAALSVTLLMSGFLLGLAFTLAGFLVLTISLAGWVIAVLNEP